MHPLGTLCAFGYVFLLGVFLSGPVRSGIAALLSVLLELWTDQAPISLSSTNGVQRGEWRGRSAGDGHSMGVGAKRGRERGGSGQRSLTHHLDMVPALSTYASVSTCTRLRGTRDGSGVGHQMVTVWAGPQRVRKKSWGQFLDSLPPSFSLSSSLQWAKHKHRVMGDNGADTNKCEPLG